MYPPWSPWNRSHASNLARTILALSVVATAHFTAGCGVGASTPAPTGNTNVLVLLSSTANDRLTQFELTLNSLTLTTAEGKSTTLLASPEVSEFMHLNGAIEPLLTGTVSNGIYVSATASIGQSDFSCVALDPAQGDIYDATFAVPAPTSVTINLPSPLTISGGSAALSLNLLVSNSETFQQCFDQNIQSFAITPTFTLAPLSIAAQPTNSANGKATGLHGSIAAIGSDGRTLTVTAAPAEIAFGTRPPTWQVSVGNGVSYQGVAGVSQLDVGLPVDMDVEVQQDGQLRLARLAVYDTDTSELSAKIGALITVDENQPNQTGPTLAVYASEAFGTYAFFGGGPYFYFNNAVFQTSGQFANLLSLPFTASFDKLNMVPGQNVYLTTHTSSNQGAYLPASTITLLPQTINGTVSAVSTEGSFTVYTVILAPYDLFPALAVQPGQTTLLKNPNTVYVYADSSAQMLNTSPIAAGGVFRFYGLVFNDSGTLRMDCAQVNDGVPE